MAHGLTRMQLSASCEARTVSCTVAVTGCVPFLTFTLSFVLEPSCLGRTKLTVTGSAGIHVQYGHINDQSSI